MAYPGMIFQCVWKTKTLSVYQHALRVSNIMVKLKKNFGNLHQMRLLAASSENNKNAFSLIIVKVCNN